MNEVLLSIGSNVTPRRDRVAAALESIGSLLDDSMASDIYETPEIHGIGRPYMNAVVSGKTDMGFERLRETTKRLELEAGRDANARERGDVHVDIDIVVWNGVVLRPNDFRQPFFRIGAGMIGIFQDFRS